METASLARRREAASPSPAESAAPPTVTKPAAGGRARPAAARVSVWPPLPMSAYARAAAHPLPFPLEEEGCRLFLRARHGLFRALQQLKLEPGDEVLAPAWHHGSEIEAIERAGLRPRFYDTTAGLEPDEGELESLLGPRVRALHLTHPLGFPVDARRWRGWCDAHGILLIEDAAQAWLATAADGRPVGDFGLIAIFCLYKSVGIPGGAAVLAAAAPDADTVEPRLDPRWAVRSVLGAAARRAGLRRLPALGVYDADADVALGDPGDAPAATGAFLLPRLGLERVAPARRSNFRLLAEELGELIPEPFRDLPDGAAPFAFPVETTDKPALLARLAAAGVEAVDLWSVPHRSLDAGAFEGAARRRASTVALPVHQELRPADRERIVAAVRPVRSARPALRLEPVTDLKSLREEWQALGESSGNLFASWEWLSTWWRHYGAGRELRVSAARRGDGRLAAIVPLYLEQSRPVRILRFLGHGPSDQLGAIFAPAERAAGALALRRALRETSGTWDVLLGDQIPVEDGLPSLLGGRALFREASPVLRWEGGSFDGYLKARSSNFREQARRRERKLLREHGLTYRRTEDPAELDRDLDLLFRLHTMRWGDSEAFTGPRESFHRDFARIAMERGWLRLWFAELDGQPAAAWYGFRYAGAEWYYQAGRDPRFEKTAIGFVILVHTIREALDDGLVDYRLLLGGEEYKARFATGDAPVESVLVTRGAAGRAYEGAQVAGKVAGKVRRLVEQRAGRSG